MAFLKKFPDYSYKKVLFASFLLLSLFYFAGGIWAAEDEYSVDNIVVDSDGKDTADARTKALSDGEIQAFRQFVERRNPAKANEIISKFMSSEVMRVISGFEIMEEKITPNHYHAILRYNFSPQDVHDLLPEPEAPVPKASPEDNLKSKAVLVVPVFREGGTLKLWDDDNKWRSIWYASALQAGNGIVIVPIGDLDDRIDLNNDNLESATAETLAHMDTRYGVSAAYIVTANYNKKADPKPTLEVTLKKLLPGGKSELSNMSYIIRSTEDLDALMARASSDIADHLYKLQTINPDKIEYDRLKEINARINAADITEWETLRKRLLAHGNIVGIRITAISFYETSMVITFRGTPDMLAKTLVASGLRVMQDGDNLVLMLK